MGDDSFWDMDRICWIDVETTGFEPETGRLLEVAAVMTTGLLLEIGRINVVIHHHPEDLADRMLPNVFDMHTRNGLLHEVAESSLNLVEAEVMLVEFLERHRLLDRPVFLGGSSPGRVDQPFLSYYMPRFYKQLYRRTLDVSCLNLAYVNWAGGEHRSLPDKPHRALQDTLSAIELAKRVMSHMRATGAGHDLRVVPEPPCGEEAEVVQVMPNAIGRP